jgi:hypothetical protein
MPERIPQSVAVRVPLKVFLASDHVSPAIGKTVAVVISKNGGAFANPSGGATNATEVANGWYYVDLSTTDAGTAGPFIVRGTSGSCDDAEIVYTVANAHNGGFDGVPNAAAGANAGLPVLSGSATTLAYTLSTLTTYTGNTPQTGDNFPRIGVAGAGLTALGDTRIAHLDADVSSRSTYAGGAVASVTGNVGGNVVGTIGGYASGQDPATLLSAWAVEGSFTFVQSCRMWNAALGAKVDGRGTNTVHVRDLADTKNRFTLTIDVNGNVTAVTRDLT